MEEGIRIWVEYAEQVGASASDLVQAAMDVDMEEGLCWIEEGELVFQPSIYGEMFVREHLSEILAEAGL